MSNSHTPHAEPLRDEPRHDRLAEAATDLHAATRAVLLLLGSLEALQAERAFAARVFERLGEADAEELRAYEEEVEERAQLAQAAWSAKGLSPGPEAKPSQAALSEAAWAQLRRPFAFEEVAFIDVLSDPASGRGTIRPVVAASALRNRLDEGVGPAGWHLRFELLPGGLVKAELTVGGTTRENFGEGDPWLAGEEAWRRAAALFGIGVGLEGKAVMAAEVDPGGRITNRAVLRRQLAEAGVIAG